MPGRSIDRRDFMKIARAALARGHQVTVFTMEWQGPKEPGLEVVFVPKRGFSNHQRAKFFSAWVERRLAETQFDACLGFNRQAGLDFYFAADPCLAVQLTGKWWTALQPRYRSYLNLEAAVFGVDATTRILLLDPKQQALIELHYHTPEARFSVIPPGIERPVAREHVANDRCVLLSVGFDQRRKGLDRSLLAIAALPQTMRQRVQLWVVGQVGIPGFKKQVAKLGIGDCVQFLENRDDVYDLMQQADLLLHPAYQETAGMVLVEALANGLPVLVTDNCGYAFHVAAANAGRVIPGGAQFTQALYNTALQESLTSLEHSHWQVNARAYAEQQNLFTMPDIIIDRLEQFRKPCNGQT